MTAARAWGACRGFRAVAWIAALGFALVLGGAPSSAPAQEAGSDGAVGTPVPVGLEGLPREKRALGERVRKRILCACPGCPKVNPGDCAPGCAPAAKQLVEIRTLVEEGRTEEEAVQWFVETYGERILAAPPLRGYSIAAWLAPFAVLVAGGAGLAIYLWRAARRPRPPEPVPPTPAQSELHARVAREWDPFR